MWPKTVALLTSNALIIRHGTFHISLLATHESCVIDIFPLYGSFFFWWGTHKRRSREEAPNCSYTFLKTFCFFRLPFLALFNGDFSFFQTSLFFSLYLINSWHNSFFYILANGTTNELFFYFLNLFFCFLFRCKNSFVPSRTAKHKKKTLWLSCEITTYFDCCWSWTDLLIALFALV